MLDRYSFRARLCPALLAGLPAILALATVLKLEWWKESVVTGASGIGLLFLLSHVARVLGHRREPGLIARWGGLPSVLLLRHVDDNLDRHTKARYHANVATLVGIPMPTAAEELSNPQAAEHAYQAATVALKSATRDPKAFNLLFQENINYGFCRNMYGLWPVGFVLAVVGATVAGFQLHADYTAGLPVGVFAAITAGASLLMLYLWLAVVRADWCRPAAFAYAERLLEASDELVRSRPDR